MFWYGKYLTKTKRIISESVECDGLCCHYIFLNKWTNATTTVLDQHVPSPRCVEIRGDNDSNQTWTDGVYQNETVVDACYS
jgi:hypothetical protein